VQFIKVRRVLEMIGVSRTTLWRMVRAGTFPRPVRITKGTHRYALAAVEAWMKARAGGDLLDEEVAAEDGRRGKRRLAARAALSRLPRAG
jgi:prophage regulatory protein